MIAADFPCIAGGLKVKRGKEEKRKRKIFFVQTMSTLTLR